jgi:hypothetical protein
MSHKYIAIDLGAESGRVTRRTLTKILGRSTNEPESL